MEKLQQGDYVKNLTKEQFDELFDIENCGFKLSYNSSLSKSIYYYHGVLLHGKGLTELSFSEFKQRAINTFNHAN